MVNNGAEIARRYGMSRARVTQVMKLLRLPPSAQDYVSSLSPRQQCRYSGRWLREKAVLPSQLAQLAAFGEFRRAASGS